MKKFLIVLIFLIVSFNLYIFYTVNNKGVNIFDGKSNLEEGWNGLYKADSDYYIMLYTADNKKMTFNVIQKIGAGMMYPIQYDSIPIKDENTAEYSSEFFGDTEQITITRNEDKITITCTSTDTKSGLLKINGTYTKYKNVNSSNLEDILL